MKENARQGFWNGARAPIGYCVVAEGEHGAKIKKKLEIDSIPAETVRRIYRMPLNGVDSSGPMGLKSIAALRQRGFIQVEGSLTVPKGFQLFQL